MGVLLVVVVHTANVQDRDGATLVLAQLRGRFERRVLIWADGGYAGKLVAWAQEVGGWTLAIVKRPAGVAGFQVLPRRWVGERTFAWLGRCRRLSNDDEELPETSEAVIRVAMIHLIPKRLAPR